MGSEGKTQSNKNNLNPEKPEDIKRKISRFEVARRVFYGDNYKDSHFLKKGWMNFYSYYRLKQVDLSDKFPNLWKSIKGGAGWLKDSVFGSAVKKAGRGVVIGGKTAGKAAIAGTKLVGRGAATVISVQKDNTIREARAMADAALKQPAIRFLAKKTSAATHAVRNWVKEKAAQYTAMKREAARRYEAAHRPKKPSKMSLELKTPEEITRLKEQARKKKEAALLKETQKKEVSKEEVSGKEVTKKHRLSISDATAILWKGMKLSGRVVWSATKAAIKSKAVQTVKNGVVAAAKGIAKGAKFAGSKTVAGLKFAAGHAADGYNYVISRKTDILYQWNRRRAIDQNMIHEAMDALSGGKEFTDRLQAFEKSLKANKEINLHLQLRANVLRLKENVKPMSDGQTGTVELRELNENGEYKAPATGQGMIMNPGLEDLGDALIEPEKDSISKLQKKLPEEKIEEEKTLEKITVNDLNQEQKDQELLKKNELDPNHLPMQTSPDMQLVGQSAKIVTKTGKEVGSLAAMRKVAVDKFKKGVRIKSKVEDIAGTVNNISNKVEQINNYTIKNGPVNKLSEKYESGYDFYNNKIGTEINSDIALFEHGMNVLESGTAKEINAETIVKSVADGIIFTEDIFKKAGEEPPVQGLGNTILNEGMTAVKSNTAIKLDAKSIGTAAADDIIFTEAVLNKVGVKVPISGMGKTIYNVLNIADEKEREKNIAALWSNGLQQAGQILEQCAGKNIVSDLAGVMNSVNLSGRVGGTVEASESSDEIEQKKQYAQNIASGIKALNRTLESFKTKGILTNVDDFLNPFLGILDNVKRYNQLEKNKEKLNKLTEEDLSKNITDTNTIRQLGLGASDLANQIDLQKKGVVADAVRETAVSALSIITGGNAAVSLAGQVLSHVSPTQLLLHQFKHQTDHELMMRDVFGNMEKYREYKDKYRLSERQVQDEIKKLTGSATVKEYANRVRAEIAMHLYARTQQAEKSGLENGATKLREAGGIEGNTLKEVYKKIGGDQNFDNITGSTKTEAYRNKIAERNAAQTKKKQEETFKKLEDQAKRSAKKSH